MYALSVLSRRRRGHVVALSLVAVVCHGVAEVARRERRAAALAGWRGRVALEFADYLDTHRVCEPEPEPEPVFSESRGLYQLGADVGAMTGAGQWRGALDAPEFMAAGSCLSMFPFGTWPGDAVARIFRRGGAL